MKMLIHHFPSRPFTFVFFFRRVIYGAISKDCISFATRSLLIVSPLLRVEHLHCPHRTDFFYRRP
jgi:hypothetical protein